MMKRLTEEVVVPIPCPVVSAHLAVVDFSILSNESFSRSLRTGSIPLPQGEYVYWRWWLQASLVRRINTEFCRLISVFDHVQRTPRMD